MCAPRIPKDDDVPTLLPAGAFRVPPVKILLTIQSLRSAGPAALIVRLRTGDGSTFPPYEAGQHATLLRERDGTRKPFSIASAPYETAGNGFLELLTAGEAAKDTAGEGPLEYFFEEGRPGDRFFLEGIQGSFVLRCHAAGRKGILMVATGAGIAPFRSMIFDLARTGSGDRSKKITLLHSHRTLDEIAYREEMEGMQAGGSIDFSYIPLVTRPPAGASLPPTVGTGRVSAVLREIYPGARTAGSTPTAHHLPSTIGIDELRARCNPAETLMMACGNSAMITDVEEIARESRVPCVREG